MAIDPNIALGVQTPQLNPLQLATQAAQYQNISANTNRLKQQTQSEIAQNNALKSAINPQTGQVNVGQANASMAADPNATMGAQQFLQGNNTITQQNIANKLSENNYNSGQAAKIVQAGVANVLNPQATTQDLMNTLSEMHTNGVLDDTHYNSAVQSVMATGGNKGAIINLVKGGLSAFDPNTQASMQSPNYAEMGSGSNTSLVNKNPLASNGVGTVGATVQQTFTPAQAAAPVNINTNGQPQAVTLQQFANQANTNGGVNIAPPQGSEALSAGAIGRYNTLQSAANAAKPLMQTYDLAAQAAQSTLSGKGGSQALNVPSILNTFGIQVSPDKVRNNQNLVAYLNSAADQAASSLGLSGSDARVAAAKAGQPNAETMNAPALLDQIQHVKGLQQAVLDRANATNNFLAQNGNNTSQLPQFENQWNQSFNPDVSYVRSLPTPALQQAAIQKIVQSGQGQQFMQSYQAMKNLGAF